MEDKIIKISFNERGVEIDVNFLGFFPVENRDQFAIMWADLSSRVTDVVVEHFQKLGK